MKRILTLIKNIFSHVDVAVCEDGKCVKYRLKGFRIGVLSIALLAMALPVRAATTVTLTTNVVTKTVETPVVTKTTVETVDATAVNVTPGGTTVVTVSTNSATGSLFSGLQNLLSIHDPGKHYFSGDGTNDMQNSVQLNQSAVTDSRKSGIYQATQLGFWHRLNGSMELGVVGEADSLGSGGNTIDAIGGHVMLRYGWDNVAVEGGIGGIRDIAAKTGLIEFLVGFEVRISKNVGTIVATGFGYDPETKGKNGIVDRLFVGATIALGK